MLNRVLGLGPSDALTKATLVSLVEAATTESQHLDFKQELPGQTDQEKGKFKKAVAAMANGGGGVIIYGIVDEDDRAVDISPVRLGKEVTRLRQLISQIEPYLDPLLHEVVTGMDDEGNKGFLVVEIASFSRRPYAVPEGSRLGYYRRVGRHTTPISEAEVAEMYRQRTQSFESAQRRIDGLTSSVDELLATDKPRLFLAGTPVQRPERLFTPHRGTETRLQQIEESRPFRPRGVRLVDSNPIPGFKRVRISSFEAQVLEFHDDGSFSGVFAGASSLKGDWGVIGVPEDLPGFTDEALTESFVWLMAAYGRLLSEFGVSGEIVIAYGLIPDRSTRGGVWRPTALSTGIRNTPLRNTHPIENQLEAVSTADAATLWPYRETLRSASPLLSDLASAFGFPGNLQLDSDGRVQLQFWASAQREKINAWCEAESIEVVE